MNEEQSRKLSWLLGTRFNLFHSDMIQRAITDDSIDLDNFALGVRAIENAEKNGDDDEFTPMHFKNV